MIPRRRFSALSTTARLLPLRLAFTSSLHAPPLSVATAAVAAAVMRFKNRYYLVELLWESVQGGGGSAASASAASIAASSTGASAASAVSAGGPASNRVVDVSLQSYSLQSALREAFGQLFGEFVLGRVNQSLQVRYLNTLTNTAIIRVARADHRALALALLFLKELKGKAILIKTIHVSGTIRKCQIAAIKMQKQSMEQLRKQLEAAAPPPPTATATPAATGAAAATPAPTLSSVLAGASARSNQVGLARNAQQTLRQLSTLLSNYNAAKAAQAAQAASSSHHAAAAAAALAASSTTAAEQVVAPTAVAIAQALQNIEAKNEEDIMAMMET